MTTSSPICLSEVMRKPLALSRVFLLSSGGKSVLLVKKKAASRSGFPLSMHVVLKTRHVNPNIHVCRYQSHVRSPNFSTTRPQLLSLRGATTSYRSLRKSYTESVQSYIALHEAAIPRPLFRTFVAEYHISICCWEWYNLHPTGYTMKSEHELHHLLRQPS